MSEWGVIMVPATDAVMRAGLSVLVTDGDERHEVARVAFVRKQSANPEVSFEEQLQAELVKADSAASIMNDLEQEQERLVEVAREEARERAKAQLQEVFGASDKSLA